MRAAGVVLHLLVGLFPYAASGLVAPLWAVVGLYAWWLTLLAAEVAVVRRRRPLLALAPPLVAVASWFAVVSLGGAVLGWTA